MKLPWDRVLRLAWPVLLQQWLVLAVALSDRLLAGRFQSDLPTTNQSATQAAQTTAYYLSWFLSSAAVLVNSGAAAVVAHRIGANKPEQANQILHQSILLAMGVGFVLAISFTVTLVPFLHLLQLEAETVHYASRYLLAQLPALPLHLVAAAGIACLAGAGDTRTGMWIFGGEAVINLPLAWAGFWLLGFPGIAAGTAVAQALGGLAVIWLLWRGRAGLRLRWEKLRPDSTLIREMFGISIPSALDSLSTQAGHLFFLAQVNTLGTPAAAAHGIALGWEAMGYLTGAAFGTAALTLVGQARGAGRPDEAARAGWTALGLGAVAMSCMGVLFYTLAEPMFLLFCPYETQRTIVEQGVPVLRLVAFGMPALAASMILVQALRGAADARAPLVFTWLGFFGVRIPLTFALIHYGWGLWGAWLAMNIDMHVRGLCLILRWASGAWQRRIMAPSTLAATQLKPMPPVWTDGLGEQQANQDTEVKGRRLDG
ncbi:MAG: MATE family efflux transporter [Gemmataceae bacterium]